MGFEKTESAKLYTAIDGDTLQAIAERETAAGNPITWQELAKYNWGTDDPATINELLRDELGARKRMVQTILPSRQMILPEVSCVFRRNLRNRLCRWRKPISSGSGKRRYVLNFRRAVPFRERPLRPISPFFGPRWWTV